MKKMMFKRTLTFMLALVMMLSMVACGGSQQGWSDDVNFDEEDYNGKYPIEEVVDVTILVPEYGDPNYPRNWDREGLSIIHKYALEEFGINLKLEEVIGGDDNFKSILNTKLAAGSNVPDIVRYDLPADTVNNMYFKGQILNLSDYAEYMPDIVKVFDEYPSLKEGNCDSEGNILRIPSFTLNIQHISSWGNIRRDWLDTLGLESPKTTDEFRSVLQAFQDNDMNGNGKKDEVYIAYYETMNTTLAPAFGAYGLSESTKSWFVDDSGKVYSSMLTDEARNYAAYVSSMFADGLFWSESFTDNGSQSMTLVNENRRAGKFGRYWDSLLDTIDCSGYGRPDEYNPMLPLSDGKHDAKILLDNYAGSCCVMLTKDCPAPDRVVSFFNWCYSKKATDIIYGGDDISTGEGKYYRVVPLTDKLTAEEAALLNLKGDETTSELTEAGKELDARERSMQGYLGGNSSVFPMYAVNTPEEIAVDFYTTYDREATRSAGDLKVNINCLGWTEDENNTIYKLPLAVMTEEQNLKFLEYSDLFVYMNEMFRKFLSGAEPMSNWDNFVSECEKQGINDVLKIIQERYDKINK